MALRQQYSLVHIARRLVEIIESGVHDAYVEEWHDLRYWLTVERFGHATVNRRPRQYACGDKAWPWAVDYCSAPPQRALVPQGDH